MLLEVRDITCQYGSVTALRNASLEVAGGEVVAVIGSNGAGKSTLMKALAGLLPPVSGEIIFKNEHIERSDPSSIVAAGISLCAEGHRVFPALSVEDNLVLGAYIHRGEQERVAMQLAEMYELFPMLGDRPKLMAGHLSGGQQQMLAIAQALMAEPDLLLLDEPSLGLAPSVVTTVFETVARLKAMGHTIVLVEQMVRQSLEVADRGYVMQTGRLTGSGTSAELREDPVVQQAYLGLVDA